MLLLVTWYSDREGGLLSFISPDEWGWTRPKPGSWNFMQIFHIGGRGACTWASLLLLSKSHSQAAESQAEHQRLELVVQYGLLMSQVVAQPAVPQCWSQFKLFYGCTIKVFGAKVKIKWKRIKSLLWAILYYTHTHMYICFCTHMKEL